MPAFVALHLKKLLESTYTKRARLRVQVQFDPCMVAVTLGPQHHASQEQMAATCLWMSVVTPLFDPQGKEFEAVYAKYKSLQDLASTDIAGHFEACFILWSFQTVAHPFPKSQYERKVVRQHHMSAIVSSTLPADAMSPPSQGGSF